MPLPAIVGRTPQTAPWALGLNVSKPASYALPTLLETRAALSSPAFSPASSLGVDDGYAPRTPLPKDPAKAARLNGVYEEVKRSERRRHYNVFQKALRYAGFPVIMGASVLGAKLMMDNGISPTAATVSMTLASFGTSFAVDRALRFRDDWAFRMKDMWLDLSHNLLSTSAFVSTVKYLITPAVVAGSLYAASQLDALEPFQRLMSGNIENWNVWQLSAAFLLVTEYVTYALHRGVHEIPAGWHYHRVHHMPKQLNTPKASYNNPFDALKELSHYVIPMSSMYMIFGNSPDVQTMVSQTIALILVATVSKGFLQHSNSDYELGPLEYVLSGVKGHRWHHSNDPGEYNSNYGIVLNIDTQTMIASKAMLGGLSLTSKAFPSFPETRFHSGATRFATWLNSLRLPDKEAPDQVGIDQDLEFHPYADDDSWNVRLKKALKQYAADAALPVIANVEGMGRMARRFRTWWLPGTKGRAI